MQIPKNVVQAGEVDSCHKIYIEDYVNTFLKQYRTDSADFCLYGKSGQEDGISYYFIYGAIREDAGWETMQARYFPGASKIGEATCDGEESWLFFEDGYASALDGYFIFYEQNEDMQSYLIAMHQNQPGEKTVEVRPRAAGRRADGQGGNRTGINIHTDSLREKRAEAFGSGGAALPESTEEPRRIRRTPRVYDLKPEKSGEEKALHAAQHRRSAGQKREKPPVIFTGRAAGLALLLLLCVTGIASINRYRDMQEVGNFFAEAARGLTGAEEEESAQQEEVNEKSGFVVEDRQLAATENPPEEVTFPVFAPIGEQEEENGYGVGGETDTTQEAGAEDTGNEAQERNATQEKSTQDTGNTVIGEEQPAGQENASGESGENAGALTEETGENTESEAAETAVPASESGPVSYTVQKGDSLAIICRRRYGNTDRVEEIISLNDFADPNHLIPGQKILLPN